jgi:hypothetical protein
MYEEWGVQVTLISRLHDKNSHRNPIQNQKYAFRFSSCVRVLGDKVDLWVKDSDAYAAIRSKLQLLASTVRAPT